MDSDRTGAPLPAPHDPPLRHIRFLAFAVGLPIAALVFELTTHACQEILFDPIPSWPHVLLVAAVLLCVLLADAAVWRQRPKPLAVAAAGFAAGVALPYTLLFLPSAPFAVPAILFLASGCCRSRRWRGCSERAAAARRWPTR